jgi:hypothetical protein
MCGNLGAADPPRTSVYSRRGSDNRKPLGQWTFMGIYPTRAHCQRGSIASAHSLLLCVSAGAISTAPDASALMTRR